MAIAMIRALQRPDHIPTPRFHLSSRSDDPSRRLKPALKRQLGHFARPEGRDEPFRARAFPEPATEGPAGPRKSFRAPCAALRAGFQRTNQDLATRISPSEFATRTASNSAGGPVTSTCGSDMIVLTASLAGPFLIVAVPSTSEVLWLR